MTNFNPRIPLDSTDSHVVANLRNSLIQAAPPDGKIAQSKPLSVSIPEESKFPMSDTSPTPGFAALEQTLLSPALVLIIDDDPANRTVLRKLMESLGHRSIQAENGQQGLEFADQYMPDAILLDIHMPILNGYQVLDRLKSTPKLKDIPVVMVSALEETENTEQCLKAGAEDYLAKPYKLALLNARVNACLRRKRFNEIEQRYRKELEEMNVKLEERVAEKSRDLLEAQRRLAILDQAKGEFLQLISHHLRTPVTGLLGVADILFEDEVPLEIRQEFAESYRRSRDNLLNILDESLLLTQVQIGEKDIRREHCLLRVALGAGADDARKLAENRRVFLGPLPKVGNMLVHAHPELLAKALRTVWELCIVFSAPGTVVQCDGREQDHKIDLAFQAVGPQIENEVLHRLWEILMVTQPNHPTQELGLAPTLADRIIRVFGGTLDAVNHPSGVVLNLSLPVWRDAEDADFVAYSHDA